VEPKVSVLSDIDCHLGEGPAFDPHANVLRWFDIRGRRLLEKSWASDAPAKVCELPFMASAIGRIDAKRQLIAGEDGLWIRDAETGVLQLHMPLEADKPDNRSNDGRVHPSGALWIGTMSKKDEKGAGAIYWYRKGELKKLYPGISIPNSICFSPDGSIAYFTDTVERKLLRVACDPATGLPKGEPELFHDNSGRQGYIDGSVTDADGVLWNARWGGSALDAFAPDGSLIRTISLPATQTSCPAFAPGGFAVTSAWQGMDAEQRKADPKAGFTFFVEIDVRPKWEPDVAL